MASQNGLKMYEHHFYKDAWEELPSVSLENRDKWGIAPIKQGHEEYSSRGVKPNWPQLNSLCSYT
jgi:hypothetical protein